MRVDMKYATLAAALLLPTLAVADPGGAAGGAAAGGVTGATLADQWVQQSVLV